MYKNILTLIAVLFVSSMTYGQQVKKAEKGTFLLKNATLHTVSNGTMKGDLLIKDGKIAEVGSFSAPAGVKTVDVTGKHIYPGFIDGGTTLGLSEVGSVSLTQDFRELGDFIPHMQALTAVNPNAVAIPVTRVSGVTTVLTAPQGGLFPGTAALINLNGYTPERMYAGFKGVVLNWPMTGRRGSWDRRSDADIKKDEEKVMFKLNDIWKKAKQYSDIAKAGKSAGKTRNDYNPQMDALMPVIRGEGTLLVYVNNYQDILSALKWIKEKEVKAVICGASEGYRVADELAKSGIPVVTGPTISRPGRAYVRYDVNYKNPGVMAKAGVKVALRTNGNENTRNLPFNAGFAAAYGMGIDEAVKAVTLTPAEIFGVADMYGSLDKGKVANLFVCDGDPFEPKTQVEHLFINGEKVAIESRHTLLYDEFLERDK